MYYIFFSFFFSLHSYFLLFVCCCLLSGIYIVKQSVKDSIETGLQITSLSLPKIEKNVLDFVQESVILVQLWDGWFLPCDLYFSLGCWVSIVFLGSHAVAYSKGLYTEAACGRQLVFGGWLFLLFARQESVISPCCTKNIVSPKWLFPQSLDYATLSPFYTY